MERKESQTTDDGEITGYECSESHAALLQKMDVLRALIDDVRWRVNQRAPLSADDYKHLNISCALEDPIISETVTAPSPASDHTLDHPDTLVEEFYAGNDASFDTTLFAGADAVVSEVPKMLPAPGRVVDALQARGSGSVSGDEWGIIEKGCSIEYASLLKQSLAEAQLIGGERETVPGTPPEDVDMGRLFALYRGYAEDRKRGAVSELPFTQARDALGWVVEVGGAEFLHRRYLLLCNLERLGVRDYTPAAISTLEQPHPVRRSIVISDLAERGYLDMQTVFSHLLTSPNEHCEQIIQHIYSQDRYVQTRQRYMLEAITKQNKKSKRRRRPKEGRREKEDASLASVCQHCQESAEAFKRSGSTTEGSVLVKALCDDGDWYHAVEVALSLLHPAAVRRCSSDVAGVLRSLTEYAHLVWHHPQVLRLSVCCYSLTMEHNTETRQLAHLLLTLLLDYSDTPSGILLKYKDNLARIEAEVRKLGAANDVGGDASEETVQAALTAIEQEGDEQVQCGRSLQLMKALMQQRHPSFTKALKRATACVSIVYLPMVLCDEIRSTQTLSRPALGLLQECACQGLVPMETVVRRVVQPALKQAVANRAVERVKVLLEFVSDSMSMTAENGRSIWNSALSRQLLVDVMCGIDVLEWGDIDGLFRGAYGHINDLSGLVFDTITTTLSRVDKEKVIRGLLWKPITFIDAGNKPLLTEADVDMLDAIDNCSLATISLLLNVVSDVHAIDIIVHVTLTHEYSMCQYHQLLRSAGKSVFGLERMHDLVQGILSEIAAGEQCVGRSKNPVVLEEFVISGLKAWYVNSTRRTIECTQTTYRGFFLLLREVLKATRLDIMVCTLTHRRTSAPTQVAE